MDFIQSKPFEKDRPKLMTEEEFDETKKILADNPEAGKVVPGAGGYRKYRQGNEQRQKGTRSGSRIIYLYLALASAIHLSLIYDHDGTEGGKKKSDLSADDKKALKKGAENLRKAAKEALAQKNKKKK